MMVQVWGLIVVIKDAGDVEGVLSKWSSWKRRGNMVKVEMIDKMMRGCIGKIKQRNVERR